MNAPASSVDPRPIRGAVHRPHDAPGPAPQPPTIPGTEPLPPEIEEPPTPIHHPGPIEEPGRPTPISTGAASRH